MNRPKLLIVDDHEIVIEGLVRLLGERFDIVGTLTDSRSVVEDVGRLRPDVLLLDLSIPHVSGLEIMRRLKACKIAFKAIVLTMHADASLAVEALRTGASAFVLKQSSGHELLKALQLVLDGGTYLPPQNHQARCAADGARRRSGQSRAHGAATGCPATDRARAAGKGDRGGAESIDAGGRGDQIPDHAAAAGAFDRGARQLCHRTPTRVAATGIGRRFSRRSAR